MAKKMFQDLLRFAQISLMRRGWTAGTINMEINKLEEGRKSRILDIATGRYDISRHLSLALISDHIYATGIGGSVAELGVHRGSFAKQINMAFPDRKLYLFDTFEGFPEKSLEIDRQKTPPSHNATPKTFSDTDEKFVLSQMPYPDKVVIRKGFFPETAAGVDEKFCFVSLDADLYQSTLDGLSFFYPRLEEGGIILLHDYTSATYLGVRNAVFEFMKHQKIALFPVADMTSSAAIVKPMKNET